MKLPRPSLTAGSIGEDPVEAKLRGQKIYDEGVAQMGKALPSLNRLRQVAETRYQDLHRTVRKEIAIPNEPWAGAVGRITERLQRKAQDLGYREVHLIGASLVAADGKFGRSKLIGEQVRTAWAKTDAKMLVEAPADGYAYVAPAAPEGTPLLAPGLAPPTSPGQVAMAWAELYQLDPANALLFVRMADAFNFRLLGSEVSLTNLALADASAKASLCSLEFVDQRNFFGRLAATGDWVMSFGREETSLGGALVRHVCVTGTELGVGASPSVAAIIGGDSPAADGARAAFHLVPEKVDGAAYACRVSSSTAGAAPVDVGLLVFRITAKPEPPKTAGK